MMQIEQFKTSLRFWKGNRRIRKTWKSYYLPPLLKIKIFRGGGLMGGGDNRE